MTSLVFEKLAQSLAANQTWPLQIAGDFFRVESCEWPVTVEIMSAGRVVGRMANVRAGDFVRDIVFDQVRVVNGATAQAVTVQIAGGGVGSDRIVGEVAVIEGGATRTKAGQAFAGANKTAAAAGQYPHVQLWNPAASGKRVIVSEIGIDTSVAGDVAVRWSNAALAALATNPNGVSKMLGGGGSAAEVRAEANAAILGAGQLYGIAAATTHIIHKLTEPMIINPGYGVIVVAVTVATSVRGNFQFYEEAL